MRQAATAKVCLDPAKSARFSVPVLSTAGFDRLLLTLSTNYLAQADQTIDPGPESGECRLNWIRAAIVRRLIPERPKP